MNRSKVELIKSFGPGILFAGAAIGTSHLVQSTRAGAVYGVSLLGIILLANILKYPAYRFGPHYAAVTGRSLIDGYQTLGRWVVILVGVIEFPVIAIVIAATAITTAAIFTSVFGLNLDARYVGCGLIIFAKLLLLSGNFRLLDSLTKVFVAVLTISTIAATLLAIPNVTWNFVPSQSDLNFKTFAFAIALMGFMPSALDLSIMHSLWSVEKAKLQDKPILLKHAMSDLNFGYILTTLLAIFFMLMGASVLYSTGIQPADSATQFADQIISLYTNNLGEWSGTLVGLAALMVMFTTLMTVLDGMPRLLSAVFDSLDKSADNDVSGNHEVHNSKRLAIITLVMGILAMLILIFLMGSFTSFIDLVTIIAFVVGPIIALLNHKVIFGPTVEESKRPSRLLKVWSRTAIVFLALMSLGYLMLYWF
jgi:Mn2+/Fe2+ NRAMP family transporter